MMKSYKKALSSFLLLPTTLSALFLTIATWLFYLPSLHYGYVFDDTVRITNNFHLRSYSFKTLFFADSRWLSNLLNYITYTYWNIDPFGYRCVSLALHIGTGLLIFSLLLFTLPRIRNSFFQTYVHHIALITTGLFLLYPTQTQTATYITQMRLEGLAAFFIFLILNLFSRAVYQEDTRRRSMLYGICVLLTILASGSKEIIIVFPLLLLLFDWFFLAYGSLPQLKKRFLIHGLLAASLWGTFALYPPQIDLKKAATMNIEVESNRGNRLTPTPDEKITTGPFLMTQFRVVLHYLTIFFWPFNLSFDYDIKLATDFFSFPVLGPLFALLLIMASGLWLFLQNKTNLLSFALAWFFIPILPRASIIPSPELVCDYKTYISSFSLFLFVAFVLVWGALACKKRLSFLTPYFKQHSLAIIYLLFLPIGYTSTLRNRVWRSSVEFWSDVIQKAPHKPRAYNNYAAALAANNDITGAIDAYTKAIKCDASYGEPHINLAYIYQSTGKREEALKHYQEGLKLVTSAHPEMYENLGMFNFDGQDYERAKTCFKIAIQLRPHYSRAHFNLGRVYLLENAPEEAYECFNKAIHGDNQSKELWHIHGQVAMRLNKWEEAIKSFHHVLQEDPAYNRTLFFLASCYYQQGLYDKAAYYFEQDFKKSPSDDVAYNLAQSLLHCNEYAKALPFFESCKGLLDKYPFVPLHIAKCNIMLGNVGTARTLLQECLKTTPHESVKKEVRDLLKTIEKNVYPR